MTHNTAKGWSDTSRPYRYPQDDVVRLNTKAIQNNLQNQESVGLHSENEHLF